MVRPTVLKVATPLWTVVVVVLVAVKAPGPLPTLKVTASLLSVVMTLP